MKRAFLAVTSLVMVTASTAKAAPALTTVYSIPSTGDGCGLPASAPSQLTPYDGALYGTTPGCGTFGFGTIFRYDPSSRTETVLYSFRGKTDGGEPHAALTPVGNSLYGTTKGQTSRSDGGTIFKFDPATGAETVLHQFAADGNVDGSTPLSPLLAFNGLLYGTTSNGGAAFNGTVFSFDPTSGIEQVVYAFQGGTDGGVPVAGLVALNGLLYGTNASTKANSSTVFAVNPLTGTEKVLHVFQGGADGSLASSGVTVLSNQLYGVAAGDGTTHGAIVYQVDPASGVETVLYSFPANQGSAAGLLASGGVLLGSTYTPGTVFSFDPANSTTTTLYSFASTPYGNAPASTLTLFDGLLYGTSVASALDPTSALFTVDPKTGAGTTAYDFTGAFTASFFGNRAGVSNLGGKLGVTSALGGSLGQGAVLSVNPSTHVGTQVTSFLTRAIPNTPVVQIGGVTYGTTQLGGANGLGTIFKTDISGATSIIYSFGGGADGSTPLTGLTTFGGRIYGVTSQGQGSPGGTLFSLDPATGTETNIFSFSGTAGSNPRTALSVIGKLLYGTCPYGGNFSSGTVYSFDPVMGTVIPVHQFAKGDARYPSTPVVALSGALYGGADAGTTSKTTGAIYKIDLSTNTETVVYDFVGNKSKAGPAALTVLGSSLFGTIEGSGLFPHQGTVFKLDPSSSTLTTLYTFHGGAAGDVPSSLIHLGTALFGTTQIGGANSLGTVFKITP